MSNTYKNYNPDILETIANLSNDEVFTPPELANEVLDLLPEKVWSNPNLTFLDPAVKTGIFLREIASRLIDGLADEIPDLQERVNHILTKQVYGVGITELTTLMSRRTLYCSMTANGKYSICTEFDTEEGNIRFPDTKHDFHEKTGRCDSCGANKESYESEEGRENHAYSFIHDNFEEVFGDMKFDVIIGNPPYQLDIGVEGRNSAMSVAIYHEFVSKAKSLNPKYISMIIPSRWMSGNPRGIPEDWISEMINDRRIQEVHDFVDSEDCFKGVMIRGGVNYFLWNRSHNDKCNFHQHFGGTTTEDRVFLNTNNSGVVIRDMNAMSIINKVGKVELDYLDSRNFSTMVSPKTFFTRTVPPKLTSNWRGYNDKKDDIHNIKYYMSEYLTGASIGWIKESDVPRNKETVGLHKLYINSVGHNEKFGQVIAKPFYGEPNSACSQSYLVIGYDPKRHDFKKDQLLNVSSYMKTKFFRFMVDVKKNTQDCARGVYQFVPLQDWSKTWADEELYKKYKLTQEEIDYIEDNIAPMED